MHQIRKWYLREIQAGHSASAVLHPALNKSAHSQFFSKNLFSFLSSELSWNPSLPRSFLWVILIHSQDVYLSMWRRRRCFNIDKFDGIALLWADTAPGGQFWQMDNIFVRSKWCPFWSTPTSAHSLVMEVGMGHPLSLTSSAGHFKHCANNSTVAALLTLIISFL